MEEIIFSLKHKDFLFMSLVLSGNVPLLNVFLQDK